MSRIAAPVGAKPDATRDASGGGARRSGVEPAAAARRVDRFQFSIANLMVVVLLAAIVFGLLAIVEIPLAALLVVLAALTAGVLSGRVVMLLPFKDRVGVALGCGSAGVGAVIWLGGSGRETDLGLCLFLFGLLILVVTFHAWMKR